MGLRKSDCSDRNAIVPTAPIEYDFGYDKAGNLLLATENQAAVAQFSGQLPSGAAITGPAAAGLGRLISVEDAAEVACDLRSHRNLRHMSHSILYEVELAALTRHPGEDSLSGGFESGVIVADDEFDAVHAAGDEDFAKLPPVHLSLGELHAAAEDSSLPSGPIPMAVRRAHGTIAPSWRIFS